MGARIRYFPVGFDQGGLVIYLVFPMHIRLFMRKRRMIIVAWATRLFSYIILHLTFLLHFSDTYLLGLNNVSYQRS